MEAQRLLNAKGFNEWRYNNFFVYAEGTARDGKTISLSMLRDMYLVVIHGGTEVFRGFVDRTEEAIEAYNSLI